ncbi:hypothetical protein AB4Z42_06995 [Mycobacterium sp. 2YAF39]|uniref:hypothetical protein n=1 Tax=Mycobacterium sp. 2YAF39 TaxID=3233033 RepID=UPI003F9A8796
MTSLAAVRPIFHAEFDFQFALAWTMKEAGIERIRLEPRIQVDGFGPMRVDILAHLDDRRIALELKYPKRAFTGTVSADGYDEHFALRASDAPGDDAMAIWQDARRIEIMIEGDAIQAGAVVALSNFDFWNETSLKQGGHLHDFRLWNQRMVPAGSVMRAVAGTLSGTRVETSSAYQCQWHPYSAVERAEFRYLVLEPAIE